MSLKFFAFLSVLVPFAFASAEPFENACPNLQGTYACLADGVPQALSIQQRLENGVSVFKVSFSGMTEELVADGQPRTIDRNGERMTYTSNCKADGVVAKIEGSGVDYKMLTDIVLTQSPTKALSVVIKMTTEMDGEVSTNSTNLACKKIL